MQQENVNILIDWLAQPANEPRLCKFRGVGPVEQISQTVRQVSKQKVFQFNGMQISNSVMQPHRPLLLCRFSTAARCTLLNSIRKIALAGIEIYEPMIRWAKSNFSNFNDNKSKNKLVI